tara:strand:+ start:920 stop:1603 length:684 start_codon:yes stop_codon:yes gene_type:complete
MNKTTTGAEFLDTFFNGGYDCDVVTTIYGPSGSGKTNLCLLAAVKCAEQGKKVIYIDTEGGIAVERIKQLSRHYEEVLKQIVFFKPINFVEQGEVMEKLKEYLDNNPPGLIVVDSISMLYRLELGKNEGVYEANNSLGRQMATLVEISRSKNISVIITNQVYSDFDNRDKVKMVGGDLLKYGSKCLLELRKNDGFYELILRKHRFLPDGMNKQFKIVSEGLQEHISS